MATEKEIQDAIDALTEDIDEVANDTARWSQDESAEIHEAIGYHCIESANTIRGEMDDGEDD